MLAAWSVAPSGGSTRTTSPGASPTTEPGPRTAIVWGFSSPAATTATSTLATALRGMPEPSAWSPIERASPRRT